MNSTHHANTRTSRTGKLAAFFRSHANVWINGLDLGFSGAYAWRSRISDLRRQPWRMTIVNRQRRIKRPDGSVAIVSEYRFIPEEITTTQEVRQARLQPGLPL